MDRKPLKDAEFEELVYSNSEDEDEVQEEPRQEKKLDLGNLAHAMCDAKRLADFFH
jgi:hypothetical protein